MVTVEILFPTGTRVYIDGEKSISAVVTGVAFYTDRVQYLVEWFNGGSLQTAWFDYWRLARTE